MVEISGGRSDIETLKANLDKGVYITKSHYDLELTGFRQLWEVVSSHDIKARSLMMPNEINIITPDGSLDGWKKEAAIEATTAFISSHNKVFETSRLLVPFYPESITNLVMDLLVIDDQIVKRLATFDDTYYTATWYEELQELTNKVHSKIAELEKLIRQRLEILRVMV
jgi:hypothetical protein